MRITVLGATGGIGRAITSELAQRGHEVTAASRTVTPDAVPAGVRALPTDLRDREALDRATVGAEVVVMAAQVPYASWAAELAPLMDAAADAAARAGARLVVVDNLYAYGVPDGPISATSPEDATTRKGRLRAAIGRSLLDRDHRGEQPVTIGRFSDYYGPGGTNSLLYQLVLRPAVAGRTARTYIAADQPHTFAYLPDAARGFATLVERPEADGRVWVLPAVPPVTQTEVLDLVASALGRPIRRGHVSRPMLRLAGLADRQLREAVELSDQFARPYVTDAGAFEAAFGTIELTPHDRALATTLAWCRDRAPLAA